MNGQSSKEKPLVSVCMITYKHEKFIREAIEGVLMQCVDFKIEVIISDDESPDNTSNIVNKVISSHHNGSWIKYVRQGKNLGVTKNFQWTLSQCTGDYIAFCEGDDYWTDIYKLTKQVDFLEKNPDKIFCAHYYSILDFNGSILNPNFSNEIVFINRDSIMKTSIHLSTLLVREQVKEFSLIDLDNLFSTDFALMAYLSTIGEGAFLPFDGGVYRRHSGGIKSGQGNLENYKAWINSRYIVLNRIAGVNKRHVYSSIIKIQRYIVSHNIKNLFFLKSFIAICELLVLYIKRAYIKTRQW